MAKRKIIKILCDGTKYIDFHDLYEFQEDIKVSSKEDIEKLKNEIKKGFKLPFAIWKYQKKWWICDGHQRKRALTELEKEGWYVPNLPAIEIFAKTKEEAKQNVLLFISTTGEVKPEKLKLYIEKYKLKLDNLTIRIKPLELSIGPQEETKQDDVIPEEVEPITKTGDLWELGRHRVLCGDSTKEKDVGKLMNGEKADIVFTSPPYNSGNADFTYNYKAKKEGGFYRNNKDNMSKKEYFDFSIKILQNIKKIVNKKHSVFWNIMYNANSRDDYGKIIFSDNNPFKVKETIIWNKGNGFPVAGNNILSRQCELIFLLATNEKYLTNQHNKIIYWNRWDLSVDSNTQKVKVKIKACFPVKLPEKAIIQFSLVSMIIGDFFLGSGSTLIACEKTGRICYGMEIEPHYCDVIVKRYIDWCGKNKRPISIKLNGKKFDIRRLLVKQGGNK